ncbi:MAG TPA: hypothetical protein VFF41_05465 [Gallionella sp.]|nr:hypothetical protein [Gallionella sp.]
MDELLKDSRSAGVKRYLRKVFIDPMTGKAEWGLVRVGGQIVGVHSLSTKMPIKQNNFEADDMSFRGKEKYSDWVFTYPSDLLLRSEATNLDAANPLPLTSSGSALPSGGDGINQSSKP